MRDIERRVFALNLANERTGADRGFGELLAAAAAITNWIERGVQPEEVEPIHYRGDQALR